MATYDVVLQGLCRVWSQTLWALSGSKSSLCDGRFHGFSSREPLMKFSSDILPEAVVNNI